MLSAFRARRTRTTRDSMVGSSASGADVVSTITVSAGGSSSALSRALAAASAPIWGTRRSASPTMKTLCCPNAGVSASRRNSSRTDAIPWLASPDGGSQPAAYPLMAVQGGDWQGGNVDPVRYPVSSAFWNMLRLLDFQVLEGACAGVIAYLATLYTQK